MLVLVAILIAAAHADVAVLDVKTGAGVDASLGPYLTQVIAAEVAQRTGTRPLVKDDLKALLGFEAARQKLGCPEGDSCIAEIAGALGVSRLIDASVSASGEHYLVTAALLDARKAQPLARSTELSAREVPALTEAMRRATARLFGEREQKVETQKPKVESAGGGLSRKGWAAIAGGGAVALAAGGVAFGLTALSAAHDAAAGTARRRAHVADILFVGALASAGVAFYLWRSDTGSAQVSPTAGGAAASLELRW